MKSRAQINGHPLHPILVCFPIAFYTGTLLFDVLAKTYSPEYLFTAYNLEIAALAGAALAAIPGIIDFIYTIPPDSTAKKRGGKHGLTNIAVMLLYVTALIYRANNEVPDINILIALEGAGWILLLFAGWMGGTLVYRNQIGVDPRYAEAGKWKEEYYESCEGEIKVGKANDLKINQMKLVHIGNKRIVLANSESGYVAFDDRCTHSGGSLAAGAMMCGTVQCPWHGSQFSVTDGTVKAGPAKVPIVTYNLRQENGILFLTL
ncbi:MAG TPA: DUF2231 domain-containing protein [Flavitalea sp.]|nr:DUF2231 domain-containing protein [Flavitalea sp.]